jgi:hypothetical protein
MDLVTNNSRHTHHLTTPLFLSSSASRTPSGALSSQDVTSASISSTGMGMHQHVRVVTYSRSRAQAERKRSQDKNRMVCSLWPDCELAAFSRLSNLLILRTVPPVAKGMSSVMKRVRIAVLVKGQIDLANTLLARRFRQVQIEIMYDEPSS